MRDNVQETPVVLFFFLFNPLLLLLLLPLNFPCTNSSSFQVAMATVWEDEYNELLNRFACISSLAFVFLSSLSTLSSLRVDSQSDVFI